MIHNIVPNRASKLVSIAVTTPPTKTVYTALETLDLTGMVVTATYENGKTKVVTDYLATPATVTGDTTEITVLYTENGITKTATQAITVNKIAVTIPYILGTITYTGRSQRPLIISQPSLSVATRGGTESAINAGTYTRTYTLVDTVNYAWATTWDGNLVWSIEKATGTLTLSKDSISLDSDSPSDVVSCGGKFDGTISVSSSNNAVATAVIVTTAYYYSISSGGDCSCGPGKTYYITIPDVGDFQFTVPGESGTWYYSDRGSLSIRVNLSEQGNSYGQISITVGAGQGYDFGPCDLYPRTTATQAIFGNPTLDATKVITITGVGSGSATITVTPSGGTNYTTPAAQTISVTANMAQNPLNTDTMTLGDATVYFTDYPSIKWQVMHVDGNYVYLALAYVSETSAFGANATYSGSTLASKCVDYLNNTIPNVADKLENVTVNGVTAKVFVPSRNQLATDWDYPKQGDTYRQVSKAEGIAYYWTSSMYSSTKPYYVRGSGSLGNNNTSDNAYGFRPAVKVQFKGF